MGRAVSIAEAGELERETRRWGWLTLAALVAVLALHWWSLMRFPAPYVDEGWFASRAWGMLHSGRAFGPLDAGVFDRFAGYWVLFPWLPTFVQSLALRLAAAPALLPLRALSLLFGLALLALIYRSGTLLGGRPLGRLSALLTALSAPFLHSSHLARYDVMAAVLGFAALALYLSNRSAPRWWVGLLAGLCVGLAFEVHPQSTIYGLALMALHFLDLRRAVLRHAHFWAFGAGWAVGLAIYAAIHVLPYPQTYLALTQLAFGPTHTPPLLTLDPRVILRAVGDTTALLIVSYTALIPLIIWAVIVLARRRSRADQTILVLTGAMLTAFPLLTRIQIFSYAILFSPLLDTLLAAFLLWFVQRPYRRRAGDVLRHGLVWGLCAGALLLNLSPLRIDLGAVHQAAQRRVAQSVQAGDTIMASQVYWFGLYDHPYYSWEELVFYRDYAPGSALEDALEEFRPDVLVMDRYLGAVLADPQQTGDAYFEAFRLSRAEMEDFLARRARLVDEFDGGYYGHIRVYRIEWGQE